MINRFLSIFLLLFLLLLAKHSCSQYYILGQDPASQKWYTIKTAHFKILFPAEFLPRAKELANKLEYMYEHGTQTLQHQPKLIPVVVHTQGVVPNAYSLWTPKRTEFFMTPPQNNYAHDWLEQLVVHEYRHMIQMDKMNKGTTRVLNFIIGQHAGALALGLFLPMWYMEGDAVVVETAMSQSGRGRLPSFEMKMRAQLLEKGLFDFEKASLGSYKENVPDQYFFGYFYIAQSRRFFGPELWEKAINNSGRHPWQLSPISHSFKQQTGLSKKQLYRMFFMDLRDQWMIQAYSVPVLRSMPVLLPEKKAYTNYRFPRFINDSIIIAEKSGMDNYPIFVQVNLRTGNEKVVTRPGFYTVEELPTSDVIPVLGKNSPGSSTADNLSVENGKMSWSEKKLDPRWDHRSYSVIMVHDFASGKTRQITHKSRLFAPALFPDAKKIVAVNISSDNHSNLVILDSESGETIKALPNPDSMFFMIPAVSPDGKNICCVAQSKMGKALVEFHLDGDSVEILFGPSFQEISNPCYYGNIILFNASFSGIDNVYALDRTTKNVFQVSSEPFGACDADVSPDGSTLMFSSYHSDGYILVTHPFDINSWIPLDSIKDSSIKLYKYYLPQESGPIDLAIVPDSNYSIEKYRKALHLFNFHSWLPVSINLDNYSPMPGLSILSQNLLTTSILQTGYEYIPNENAGRFYASYDYLGWYPKVGVHFSNGLRSTFNPWESLGSGPSSYNWNSTEVGLGLSVPLTSTYRQFFQKISLSTEINYHKVNFNSNTLLAVPEGELFSAEAEIHVSNREKTVLRDLAPRFGQEVNYLFRTSLGGDIDLGKQSAGGLSLFFPGLAIHHSLKTELCFQKKHADFFSFEDHFIYPRGYTNQRTDDVWRLSVNYKMPIWYPDLHIGSLLFFRRLKTNVFADYGEGNIGSVHRVYKSFGAEVSCDTHVFRFFIPLDIGLRFSHLPVLHQNRFEFLLGINFSGF